ncbi:MAG TPA: diacylglycerol kinase family protein [Acidimicrobiia bacterium]|nr:diacylglycerol kinase family protein [Acidimicrobiia bacterium]
MPRWLVAVNRSAGRLTTDPSLIAQVVGAVGLDFELVAPDSPSEMAAALVAGARRGFEHFALAGGDGTVNLAVNALLPLGLEHPPVIGVLPAGTGCDLLRTFGLPQDLPGAARHLMTENVYPIDVGALEGEWGLRYFVNVAQAGVGAAAAQSAVKIARWLGSLRYPMAFGARLPRFPRARITLTTERKVIESDALAVIFANAQFFAGGWNVAPKATLVDGVLDIQIFDVLKRQAAALVPKVVKGTHLREPGVRRLSVSEFTLVTEPFWPVEADGDLIGNTTLKGRVIRAAVRLKI